MTSDPVIRESLALRLSNVGRVEAETLSELKLKLGMSHISNTQFNRALGSLTYNSRCVLVRRPRESIMEDRPYVVYYKSTAIVPELV